MAPIRTKKRKISMENGPEARQQTVAHSSPVKTPTRSPQRKVATITEAQKRALIDNLQLEVTERARKLRAQYALQAQSLRTRIELRINRIPTALRKANMGDLFKKYMEMSDIKQKTASEKVKPIANKEDPAESEKPLLDSKTCDSMVAPSPRGAKRHSDAMEPTDKENTSEPVHEIPNPKKRTRVAKGPSRQVTNPSTVLSPKSANSRTLPQSSARPILGSPQKSHLSQPASPLKQFSPIKSASAAKAAAAAMTANLAVIVNKKPKAGRPKAGTGRKATNPTSVAKGGTVRGKRGAALTQNPEPEVIRKASNTSNISSASNATAIVKSSRKGPAGTSKKNEIGVRAVGKRIVVEAPQSGRRVLRKRA